MATRARRTATKKTPVKAEPKEVKTDPKVEAELKKAAEEETKENGDAKKVAKEEMKEEEVEAEGQEEEVDEDTEKELLEGGDEEGNFTKLPIYLL